MTVSRPLVLVDLDDTLFQTARRMGPGPRAVAALDRTGAPISYLSPIQGAFVDWLLASADVAAVTARSVEAYRRVQIPLAGPAVCAHGAVLLDERGEPDPAWQRQMRRDLAAQQEHLLGLSETLLQVAAPFELNLRTWAVMEDGLATYVVAKHDGDETALARFAAALPQLVSLTGLYLHLNGSNLALLPQSVSKRRAVDELLRRDRQRHGERPVIGFGDSLSDLGFLDACHWWGTPRAGQVARWMKEQGAMAALPEEALHGHD